MEKEKEKIPEQEKPNYTFIEHVLDETHEDLPEEILDPLVKDIDSPKSYALLVRYLKSNIQLRLPEVIRTINFEFSASPKTFDAYNDFIEKIGGLLEEKDGVIDETKREQARLLLRVIKDIKVPE